ncbi:MAG: DUF1460 domain-containing protein [Alphaproteobacteria bacterium]|nr:DUF1460 domain-containing protein [Alphaproteobacteria bacterium]
MFLLYGCTNNISSNIGQEYMNAIYLSNPLGEEKEPDTDLLIRFDAFDCTTFVETVLANGNKEKLTQIRYKNGNIDILNRNHFIETDWLQNNKDIVENVSHLYGKTAVRHIENDKKSWFKKIYNIDTDFKKQITDLEYIPYENLAKIDIKSPMIILFVHDGAGLYDKIGTDLAVTHMGFIMPNGILRHASSEYGKIIDADFWKYIEKKQKNKHNIGVTLVKIK